MCAAIRPKRPIDTLEILPDTCALNHLIDSLVRTDAYLSMKSPAYSTDSLSSARIRITNKLRNRGYYFFRPEFIEYLADSLIRPEHITMRMMLASNAPAFALKPFKTGKVTVYLNRYQGGGTPDTIEMKRATLIRMQPSRFRSNLVNENVTFRPGRTFSVRDMNRTQSNLSRLGIFNAINIEARPDTLAPRGERLLDIDMIRKLSHANTAVNAAGSSMHTHFFVETDFIFSKLSHISQNRNPASGSVMKNIQRCFHGHWICIIAVIYDQKLLCVNHLKSSADSFQTFDSALDLFHGKMIDSAHCRSRKSIIYHMYSRHGNQNRKALVSQMDPAGNSLETFALDLVCIYIAVSLQTKEHRTDTLIFLYRGQFNICL